MSKVLYEARATVRGGRDGHGTTDDGALDLQLRTPAAMGGQGGGTNPEQLFALGYAACFDGALGVAARRKRVELAEVQIDSAVRLVSTDDRSFALSVSLDATLPGVDDADLAVELVRAAHEICPYSNATRGNIAVQLTANGRPVG